MNSSGTALLYSAILAGSSCNYGSFGSSIAVDSAGEAVLTGQTYGGFPVTAGAFQTNDPLNGSVTWNYLVTGFVAKLNAYGTALIFSTYLGGSAPGVPTSVVLDSADDVYVAGWTIATDFPATKGAYQISNRSAATGGANEFVTKLNSTGTALTYSTYIGGSGETAPTSLNTAFRVSLAVDALGSAYVAGSARSATYPVSAGAFQTHNKGLAKSTPNITLTKLNQTGTAIDYSTYIGGSGATNGGDYSAGVAVDSTGHAYVAGSSYSSDFPVTKGAFQTKSNGAPNGYGVAVVLKMNPDGKSLAYATFLGGSGDDGASGLALNQQGDALVVGTANSADFPVTPDAIQLPPGGFLTELNPTGSAEVYSTSFANPGYGVSGVSDDGKGGAYLFGTTGFYQILTTTGAYITDWGNFDDPRPFISKFYFGSAAQPAATTTALSSSANPQITGQNVTITATVAPASGTGTPAGTVAFTIYGTTLAKVALDKTGKATYSTSALGGGQDYILASYSGSSAFAPSGGGLVQTMNAPTATAPAISPASGLYTAFQTVSLTDAVKGASIYYTTNGLAPSSSSTKYTGPFTVFGSETVQAMATAPGYNPSPVNAATFTLVGSPVAISGTASGISSTAATVSASVNALGLTGSYFFAYGTSSKSLSQSGALGQLSGSANPTLVTAQLTGLKPKTVYYNQIVATTLGGTGLGDVLTFTTH